MINRLSISNSSVHGLDPDRRPAEPSHSALTGRNRLTSLRAALTRIMHRLPTGGVFACLFIATTHLVVVWFANPHPLARADLRMKILELTEHARPIIVFAGDSRAECNLDPSSAAIVMGLDPGSVVNIAVRAGESAMALAAYQNYEDRFAKRPILVLSVSPHNVSDRSELDQYFNAEYYWSVGMAERVRSLSIKDAIVATATPERLLVKQLEDRFGATELDWPWSTGGFRPLVQKPEDSATDGFQRTIDRLRRWRCFAVGDEDATPWQQLRADLRQFQSLGVQVVLLDAPDHPAMLQRLANTPDGRNYQRFREILIHTARNLRIPLLSYDASDLGNQSPDDLFHDGVHLNAKGAELLTQRVARDLIRLCDQNVLHLPSRPSHMVAR